MSTETSVAVVLPDSYFGEAEWKHAEAAQQYVETAAARNAEMVFFPEGYPGPATGPLDQPRLDGTPIEMLRETAAEQGVWVAASDVERNPGLADTYFLTLKVIAPDGDIAAKYVRVQPDTPPLNAYLYDGKAHLLPGDDFEVVDTPLGELGLLICSELWVPEIPRILMLRGAEVIFTPIHGPHSTFNRSYDANTWKHIARARAAENTCCVVVTHNGFMTDEEGKAVGPGAFVAMPEGTIAERTTPGILMADIDMARIDFLRSRNYDEEILSDSADTDVGPISTRPGQLWERRPELYAELAQPSRYSFDYDYYEDGLDAWIDEYDQKIYDGSYEPLQERFGKLEFGE